MLNFNHFLSFSGISHAKMGKEIQGGLHIPITEEVCLTQHSYMKEMDVRVVGVTTSEKEFKLE